MGERGTRSAREIASIVLLDDNFRTIVRAIAEGRQLFRNLQLSFAYLLAIHIPLVVTAALIPLAGLPLLYLPVHIVWLELMIHPTALLVFQELPTTHLLRQQVRDRRARFFGWRDWLLIGGTGVMVSAVVMGGYIRSLADGDVPHARAMALVALTTASAVLTATLSGLRTRTAWVVAGATIVCSVLLVQIPPMALTLHLTPLHLDDWSLAAAGGVVACLPLAASELALRAKRGGRSGWRNRGRGELAQPEAGHVTKEMR